MNRLASVGFIVGLLQSATAQTPDVPLADERRLDTWLSELRVDEVTDTPATVVVRTSRTKADGRLGPGIVIFCHRGTNGSAQYFVIQDPVEKTDERWGSLPPGACDALLAAARRRKDAQER